MLFYFTFCTISDATFSLDISYGETYDGVGVFRRMRGGGLGSILELNGLLRGGGRMLEGWSILNIMSNAMFLKGK